MDSCDFACDFILSAISASKFENAKKLCEILNIKDKNMFAYLYGISNIALKNYHLTRTVCSSNAFKLGLNNALAQGDNCWIEGSQCQDLVIKDLEDLIKDESYSLRKIFSGNNSKPIFSCQ